MCTTSPFHYLAVFLKNPVVSIHFQCTKVFIYNWFYLSRYSLAALHKNWCILPYLILKDQMAGHRFFNSWRIPKLTWCHFFVLGHKLKAYIVNLMANYGQFTKKLGFVEYSQRIRYFTITVAQSHYLILISTVLQ